MIVCLCEQGVITNHPDFCKWIILSDELELVDVYIKHKLGVTDEVV